MRFQILYTGGTIGMRQTATGLAPGAGLRGWLAARIESQLPEHVELAYGELSLLIDSSDATPESWQQIADALLGASTEAGAPDAFVILHGTDTMAYTAAALSYALATPAFTAPVVLTGAQLPLDAPGSDAAANVVGAIRAAADPRTTGVTVFFGRHLFQGNRVTKDSSWAFEAYRSPNLPPIATVGAPWRWATPSAYSGQTPATPRQPRGWQSPRPYAAHDIAVLDFVPGLSDARAKSALVPFPEAVLLRAYGVGNVPAFDQGLKAAFSTLASQGCPIVVCSQCPQAELVLGRYVTGDRLLRFGAVGAGDMTFEAAYAKLVFLLSQGLRGKELADWIPRSIAGEVAEENALSPAAMEAGREAGA